MLNLSDIFGNKLKYIRRSLKITQEELALKCGMEASHIGQLERGEKNPTLNTLYRISNGLNISIPELIDFENELIFEEQDEVTNKLLSYLKEMDSNEKNQILDIIKVLKKYKQKV